MYYKLPDIMKKKLSPVVLIIGILLIGGLVLAYLRFFKGGDEDTWICVNNQWVKHGNPSASMPEEVCSSANNGNIRTDQNTNTTGLQGKGIIDSIKNALVGSGALECRYGFNKGGESITYLKGNDVRVLFKGDDQNQPGNLLMKGDKMYIWSEKTKQGMMMTIDKDKINQFQGNANYTYKGRDEIIAELEKEKNLCQQTNVPDSMFLVPTDVKFTDLSQIGNVIQDQLENIQDKMPKDIKPSFNIPSGVETGTE